MSDDRRPLTAGEIDLARSVYGDAIDYAPVRILQRKWAFFQPRNVVMAPTGHLHFHPKGGLCRDDFSCAHLSDQGLFIHEMCHVWQHQRGLYLPLARHPFCRYHYSLVPGWPLKRYGIEQQAEIVRHAFLLRAGATVPGAPPLQQYQTILPFGVRTENPVSAVPLLEPGTESPDRPHGPGPGSAPDSC